MLEMRLEIHNNVLKWDKAGARDAIPLGKGSLGWSNVGAPAPARVIASALAGNIGTGFDEGLEPDSRGRRCSPFPAIGGVPVFAAGFPACTCLPGTAQSLRP